MPRTIILLSDNPAAQAILNEAVELNRRGVLHAGHYVGISTRLAVLLTDEELIAAHDMFRAEYDKDSSNLAMLHMSSGLSVEHLNRCRLPLEDADTADLLDMWESHPNFAADDGWVARHERAAVTDILQDRFPEVMDDYLAEFSDIEGEPRDQANARFRAGAIAAYALAASA